MARTKGPVIGVEPEPKPTETAPEQDSLETPSASFSTSSTTSTCPHCNSTLSNMSLTDFRDHVASCTGPSTVNNDSGSDLTTPPASPSQLVTGSASINDPKKYEEVVEEELVENDEVPQLEPDVLNDLAGDEPEIRNANAVKDPRPYVNPAADFDYYHPTARQEASEGDRNPAAPVETYPFPKVTDVAVFEEYLQDPEDMSCEELYRRTAVTSDVLVAYQEEFDEIDNEIFAHESQIRSEEKRADDEAKAVLWEERCIDDAERDKVEKIYKKELEQEDDLWQEYFAKNEANIPEEIMHHLQNLRNPQFMAAARKRQRAAENLLLLNAPEPEVKKTKDDLEWERRLRGRYMDPVKFDDMKQADVYGFEYSAHVRHHGQQPLEVMARQVSSGSGATSNPLGDKPNDASRTRTQRNSTRKKYGSPTPEDPEEDGNKLPLKRARKPKLFIEGVENSERSRGQSRSGTPPVKTFASGKRVGRPPAKSKLQAVQLAEHSETQDVANGSDAQNSEGAEGLIEDNGVETRGLAPSQEAQLHDAAESLVTQTHFDHAAAALPVAKPKHAGGRPKKVPVEALKSEVQLGGPAAVFQLRRKHPGGRPKKQPADVEIVAVDEVVPQAPKLKAQRGAQRRVKKETPPEDGTVEVEENGVLQSTEQDDGSQFPSAATTRPTTSDTNATLSTTNSCRSARVATREKTIVRETRAATNGRASTIPRQPAPLPTAGRSKRKRNSSDTDPNTLVVEQPQPVDPPAKKRRTRGKQASDDIIVPQAEPVPEVSNGRSKRKAGDISNNTISVDHTAPVAVAPPPKKRRRGAKAPEVEEEDSDAGIDEDSLDPIAKEALRKKRIKKEKSRKLSQNMKNRWASGNMKEAQETRRANNAIKRAHKEQTEANAAAGLPPPPPPILVGPATATSQAAAPAPAPKPESEPKAQIPKTTPAVLPAAAAASTVTTTATTTRKRKRNPPKNIPPPRPASTRARKPSRLALGLDGADDEDEHYKHDDGRLEQQFASEYDHFQALTSPTQPQFLGKRVRKSLVDLSQLMDDSEDDEIY